FSPVPDNDIDTTISVDIADGGEDLAAAQIGTITLDVIPSQDLPTAADNTVTTAIQHTFAASEFNFADVDTGDTLNRIRISQLETAGLLQLSGVDVTLNQEILIADITTGNLKYQPVLGEFGTAYATFKFEVSDGTGYSASDYTMTIDVLNPNAPNLTAGATLSYTENDPASAIDNTILVTDINDTELVSATITISAGYMAGEDFLAFADANGITGSWDPASGVLSLTGTSLMGNYQAALRSITYENTSDNPDTGDRTISYKANDGSYDSMVVTSTVTITAVNDAPVVTAGGALNYSEDDAATVIDTSITVADAENNNITSATISISSGYMNGQDVLGFTDIGNIAGSWDAPTGVLTLTGTDTVANYQAALRSVTYQNTETATPVPGVRTVSFIADDGDAGNAATSTVTVTAVNDAPTVTAGGSLYFTRGDPASIVDSAITVADVDDINIEGATVIFTAGYHIGEDVLGFSDTANITGAWNPITQTLTLTGTATIAEYQTALRSITYENTLGVNATVGSRTVQYVLDDGTDQSAPQTSAIIVNQPPVVTAGGTLAYTEHDAAAAIDSAITVADA
ncbi:MAG: hypothetical protein KAI75_08185, partial [Desulfobulbaceae bacterium]|nr:hypothetical protein [Desulfobulbaceae bacterium]